MFRNQMFENSFIPKQAKLMICFKVFTFTVMVLHEDSVEAYKLKPFVIWHRPSEPVHSSELTCLYIMDKVRSRG